MKKLLSILVLSLLLSGCLPDKSEKAIKNCADSDYSRAIVNRFMSDFKIETVYLGYEIPRNVFERNIKNLKQKDYTLGAVREWAESLKTAEINNKNKKIIEFLINEKDRINKIQDDLFEMEITDRLKNRLYEMKFKNCEKKRNEANKTFDLKWEKKKLYRAEFR